VEQRRARPLVIAVTGASGELGGRVAALLASRGVPQRLVVRDAARAPRIDGAEVADGASYGDGDAMRRAFEGADTVFLVSAGEDPDRVSLHRNAVDAAVSAGVERIVYTSFHGAAPECTFTFGRDHFHTEEHIKGTPLAWTFLRDNIYLDYVPFFAGEDGVIRGPAADGRAAAVARDDIAACALAVLTSDGHAGATYDMTGGEAFTMAEAAERVSRFAGRPVTYVAETLEEARASRAPSGAPAWEIEGWVTTYSAIAAGELEQVSGDVQRLTGREPITLDEFLRDNPDSYRHLVSA
jgi:NAD(P)H dehydrogenase (quinone)